MKKDNLQSVEKWLNDNGIYDYTIDFEDKLNIKVNVEGDVNLNEMGLKELPFKFKTILGSFYINHNSLTSLKNCPDYVSGSFVCHNNKLESLEGCPSHIGKVFNFRNNPISTLDFLPEYAKEIANISDTKLQESYPGLKDSPTLEELKSFKEQKHINKAINETITKPKPKIKFKI